MATTITALAFVLIWVAAITAVGVAIASPSALTVLLALLVAGLAFISRPRLTATPDGAVDTATHPELWAAVVAVADKLDTPAPDALVIDHAFNASVHSYGWRGQHYALTLGLPLWLTLSPAERLALLGHELGHRVNGDPLRGVVVSSGLHTLDEIRMALRPVVTESAIVPMLANGLRWVLSVPVTALVAWVYRMTMADHRRAELYADYIGSTIAGRPAMITMLERLAGLAPLFATSVQQSTLQRGGPPPLERFRALHAALSPDELAERVATALAETPSIDDTHPPTADRIVYIEHHGPRVGRLDAELTGEQTAAELVHHEDAVNRRLVALQRDAMYAE